MPCELDANHDGECGPRPNEAQPYGYRPDCDCGGRVDPDGTSYHRPHCASVQRPQEAPTETELWTDDHSRAQSWIRDKLGVSSALSTELVHSLADILLDVRTEGVQLGAASPCAHDSDKAPPAKRPPTEMCRVKFGARGVCLLGVRGCIAIHPTPEPDPTILDRAREWIEAGGMGTPGTAGKIEPKARALASFVALIQAERGRDLDYVPLAAHLRIIELCNQNASHVDALEQFLRDHMFDGSGAQADSWYCIGCGSRQDYPPTDDGHHSADCALMALLEGQGASFVFGGEPVQRPDSATTKGEP